MGSATISLLKTRGNVCSFPLKALFPGNSGLNYIQKTSLSSGFFPVVQVGLPRGRAKALLSQVISSRSPDLCVLDGSMVSPRVSSRHSDSLQCQVLNTTIYTLMTPKFHLQPDLPSTPDLQPATCLTFHFNIWPHRAETEALILLSQSPPIIFLISVFDNYILPYCSGQKRRSPPWPSFSYLLGQPSSHWQNLPASCPPPLLSGMVEVTSQLLPCIHSPFPAFRLFSPERPQWSCSKINQILLLLCLKPSLVRKRPLCHTSTIC